MRPVPRRALLITAASAGFAGCLSASDDEPTDGSDPQTNGSDPQIEASELPIDADSATSENAFEASYDHDAEELTITYDGPRIEATGQLGLYRGQQLWHAREDVDVAPLDDRHAALEAGDEIRVEDVQYGEFVTVLFTVDAEPESSLFHYFASPPDSFEVRRRDDEVEVVYHGGVPVDARLYRVVVEGEPTPTQPADEYDVLEPGDALAVEAEVGQRGAVEWLAPQTPLTQHSFTLQPDVDLSATYDESAAELSITHEGGEPLDTDWLEVTVHTPDTYLVVDDWSVGGTFSPGDALVVEVHGGLANREDPPAPAVAVTYRKTVPADFWVDEDGELSAGRRDAE